jgi:hypothetical protein
MQADKASPWSVGGVEEDCGAGKNVDIKRDEFVSHTRQRDKVSFADQVEKVNYKKTDVKRCLCEWET